MDQRTRNPFELSQVGNRLCFTAMIDGVEFVCDARNKLQINTLKRIVEQYNESVCGLQDACGLPKSAQLSDRRKMYSEWYYMLPEYKTESSWAA